MKNAQGGAARTSTRGIVAGLLILLSAIPAYGQEEEVPRGEIRGTVVNAATMEPLPGATVQVVGLPVGGSTDIEGKFTIRAVPVGTQQVRASLVGYSPAIVGDVVVSTGRPAILMVRLSEALIETETVEAVGSVFRRAPDEAVSVQRLQAEEIRRSPGGFEDVIRAISVLPGVAQAQPGRNDLVVRGGAPSENLFLIDGIEVPNINHFGTQGATGGPISFINLDFVRETAFSTGGFGAKYGDRMSSVFSVDLDDGRRDQYGGKATLSATLFGLDAQGPLGDRGSLLFSARRSYLDFIFKAADFAFVPEYWDFFGKATYDVDRDNTVTILGFAVIDDVSFFDETADQRYDNSTVLGSDQNQWIGGVSWRRLLGKGFVTTSFSYNSVKFNQIQRDSLLNTVFSNDAREQEAVLRSDVTLQPNKGTEIGFGAQAKLVSSRGEAALPGYVTSFGDTIGFSLQDYDVAGVKAAAYVQASQQVLARLRVTLGGRADYFSEIGTKVVFSPRFSALYNLTDLTGVGASVGLYHQSPSYIWLAREANRSLAPAKAWQYVLGVEHLFRADLRFRVEGFAKVYRGYAASLDRTYLVLANTGAGFGGSQDNFAAFGFDLLNNGGTGRSYGLEFLLQKKLSEIPLYGVASLTISDTRFTPLDGVERPGSFDQRVLFNLSGGYRFDERWEVSARFRLATGQPYTPYESDGTQDPAKYNTVRTETFHALDLRADRRWNFSRWTLTVYVDVQNVYNNKYSGVPQWDAREGEVEENESAIGILPSIGVSAEF